MKLSTAAEGFVINLKSEGYSISTINLYQYVLTNLSVFLKDPDIEKIKPIDLKNFFLHLRETYKPKRKNGDDESPLSGSTLQNHWKGIRTFFKWAQEDLGNKNRPDLNIKLPKNNPREIQPISESEIIALLKCAEFTDECKPSNRKSFKMRRRTANRDLALILLLLDTGLRVGEAVRMNVKDVNLEQMEIFVAPFGNSKNKTKSRVIPIGKSTKKHLWIYLKEKIKTEDSPLFTADRAEARITTNSVRLLLDDLGKRAGIPNLHPHRLRHTFSIQYLRNGGDIFTLKSILGHSTFAMVEHYLQLSQVDSKTAHRKASPVDNLKF